MNKPNKIYPCCVLCGQIPPGGLHDGLRIMGQFICSDCERTLCSLEADDVRYRQMEALLKTAFTPFERKFQRFTLV